MQHQAFSATRQDADARQGGELSLRCTQNELHVYAARRSRRSRFGQAGSHLGRRSPASAAPQSTAQLQRAFSRCAPWGGVVVRRWGQRLSTQVLLPCFFKARCLAGAKAGCKRPATCDCGLKASRGLETGGSHSLEISMGTLHRRRLAATGHRERVCPSTPPCAACIATFPVPSIALDLAI